MKSNFRRNRAGHVNRKFILVSISLLMLLLTSCWKLDSTPRAAPDILGGYDTPKANPRANYSTFTQPVVRAENWRQLVADSAFQMDEDNLTFGTYPNMNGSAVCAPIAMEFARQHLSFDDIAAEESATGWNTDNAYKLLITGEYQEPLKLTRADVPEQTTGEGNPQSTDVPHRDSFIIASKPVDLIIATEPSIDERELAHRYDVDLLAAPIAADAFVFITHRENPVNNLSTEQVRKIYTGEITNWKEVGGSDLEIVPYQRDRNSGSQTAMESMVMHDLAMMEPKTAKVRSISMSALTEAVAAEYDNDRQFAIGYSYKYYIDKLYINKDIKILSIDGIYPDNSAILSESYPFTAYYYAVIRGADRNELGGEFLDWIQSDEGRACITQAGYCPGCGHNALLKKIK